MLEKVSNPFSVTLIGFFTSDNSVIFGYDKRGICDKRIVSAYCNKRYADVKTCMGR